MDTRKKRSILIIIVCVFLLAVIVAAGAIYYNTVFKMPLKDYTASCLYMAVLDDELCRAKPTEAHTGSAKVTMSSRRESLQYRYHLYLEMNKGKSPAELLSQTSQMEAQLLSAQDEISQHEVLGADRSAALDALDKLVIIAAKDCGVDASLFEKQESKGKGHYYEAQLDGYTVYLELEAAFGAHPSAILYQRADGSNDLQLMKAYDLT